MGRRLCVCPMPRRNTEAGHPMHVAAAIGAAQHERLELALDRCLRPQELKAEHLRVNGEGVGAVQAGGHGLVDERARGGCLFGQGLNGMLEDVPVSTAHKADPRTCRGRASSRLPCLPSDLRDPEGTRKAALDPPRVELLLRVHPGSLRASRGGRGWPSRRAGAAAAPSAADYVRRPARSRGLLASIEQEELPSGNIAPALTHVPARLGLVLVALGHGGSKPASVQPRRSS